jgi:hypothetical protein
MARLGVTLHPVATALDLEEGLDHLDRTGRLDRTDLGSSADPDDL